MYFPLNEKERRVRRTKQNKIKRKKERECVIRPTLPFLSSESSHFSRAPVRRASSLYILFFICQENQARGFIGKTRIHQRTDGESGTFIMMKLKKKKERTRKGGIFEEKKKYKINYEVKMGRKINSLRAFLSVSYSHFF